jgi:dihydroorotate dehydrogenase (fumarate)
MNINLSTRYLGLELKNPLVAAASPMTSEIESLQRLEEAGIAAVVLPSLFEEQIEHDQWAIHQMHEYQSESFAESLDYFPQLDTYNTGPDSYLEKIRHAKEAVRVPVIASLNGYTSGGWTRYAKMFEDAGADALELNIFIVPTDPATASSEVEKQYLDLVSSVRESIGIPLAIKTGPFFSSLPDMARRFVDAGANGLVLFNRYLEPDIDLDSLEVVPHLQLSTSEELHLPLRWIAILAERVDASLAATSGFHQHQDVLKALLAGANVAMMASALLKYGPQQIRRILEDLESWLDERGYESVQQLTGSVSWKNCTDPHAYERANYMKALVCYSGKHI